MRLYYATLLAFLFITATTAYSQPPQISGPPQVTPLENSEVDVEPGYKSIMALSNQQPVAKAESDVVSETKKVVTEKHEHKLSWGEAHELSTKTGKALVAWVGTEALCPD